LTEAIWVLASVYDRDSAALAQTVDFLLKHRDLTIQDAEVVEQALVHYRSRPSLAFFDCMVLEIARKAGHLPIGTFDRTLAKLDGVQRIAA
jgi:predicted nucleic-acid-binding protein